MVEKELIDQVIQQAIDRVHGDKDATHFQFQVVHTLMDEMNGTVPLGTAHTFVTEEIQRQQRQNKLRRPKPR